VANVLIYDGDCGFCTTAAQWIQARWSQPEDRIVPWQFLCAEERDAMGLTIEQASQRAYWWDSSELFGAERAIARALRAARFPWRPLGYLLDLPGVRSVAHPVYLLVAKYRHRLPGGTPACKAS
jgi:predicted DCC family thiol-disulfide oxidoreductase YuxK